MIWRIRSKRVFGQLGAGGHRVTSGPVRLTYVALPSAHPQLAMAIGRRFGNAVERNRARRRVRRAFAAAWETTGGPEGAYLVTGSRSLLSMPFDALVSRLGDCLERCAAIRSSEIGSATI
ncbi:MAG: ribonuclease P protein component [Actinomycetota bacterium]